MRALSGPAATSDERQWKSREFPHDEGPICRELSPCRDVYALTWLVRYFRHHRYDVVHTHTPKAGLIGPLAARLAGVPLIVHTVHGFLFHDRMPLPARFAGRTVETWTAAWVDALLFQSSEDYAIAGRTRGLGGPFRFYVGNGIDLDRFRQADSVADRSRLRSALGIGPSDFVVGYVGRLVKEKGVLDLLRAFERFCQSRSHARLLIVGPQEKATQKDSLSDEDLGYWRERVPVIFTGYRSDVAELYSTMDLFVLPSYREGLPRALVEACTSGIPAIATEIRGNSEVLQHGVTGLLFPPGDVESLVLSMTQAADQPGLTHARAAAARDHATARFDQKQVFGRVDQAYSELWSKGQGRQHRQGPARKEMSA